MGEEGIAHSQKASHTERSRREEIAWKEENSGKEDIDGLMLVPINAVAFNPISAYLTSDQIWPHHICQE